MAALTCHNEKTIQKWVWVVIEFIANRDWVRIVLFVGTQSHVETQYVSSTTNLILTSLFHRSIGTTDCLKTTILSAR
jgi:hypothetical protein